MKVTINDIKHNPFLSLIDGLTPVLNGRDSENKPIFLGPNRIKIHRYLIILYTAKSVPSFSITGKSIDDSVYFTAYGLGNIAKSFTTELNYDRTKVAMKVYRAAEEKGWVQIKKINGETYITTTPIGDELCNQLISDLITAKRLIKMDPAIQDVIPDERFPSKGSLTLTNKSTTKGIFTILLRHITEINNGFKLSEFDES
jgi:hypothetical protein